MVGDNFKVFHHLTTLFNKKACDENKLYASVFIVIILEHYFDGVTTKE